MLRNERVTTPITPQARNTALANLTQFLAQVPQQFNLTTAERRRTLKMGHSQYGFSAMMLTMATNHPQFFPPYYNLPHFRVKLDNVQELQNLRMELEAALEAVQDTLLVTQDETFQVALATYSNVKQAAKMDLPGSTSLYKKAKEFFIRQGKSITPEDYLDQIENRSDNNDSGSSSDDEE